MVAEENHLFIIFFFSDLIQDFPGANAWTVVGAEKRSLRHLSILAAVSVALQQTLPVCFAAGALLYFTATRDSVFRKSSRFKP